MANTYTLISSNVLSSSAASVTFSSIPQTYTDLVVRMTTRVDVNTTYDFELIMNASGGTLHSYTLFRGYNPSGDSFRGSNGGFVLGSTSGLNATANTFGIAEAYIGNYTGSTSKPISMFSTGENNTADFTRHYTAAGLYRSSSAITSIILKPGASGYNWVSGSSFDLYGIKNS
jgi:hypothetical protein